MSKAQSTVLSVANHWKKLLAVFVLSALIPAGIYSVVEPYTFIESLEWSIYMLTSTGLGSHGATTLAGQILGVLLMVWGPVLLLALVTGAVVNALRVDPNAFTDEEQVQLLERSEYTETAINEILFYIREEHKKKEKDAN